MLRNRLSLGELKPGYVADWTYFKDNRHVAVAKPDIGKVYVLNSQTPADICPAINLDGEPISVGSAITESSRHLCVGLRNSNDKSALIILTAESTEFAADLEWKIEARLTHPSFSNPHVWKIIPFDGTFICLGADPDYGAFIVKTSPSGDVEWTSISVGSPDSVPTDIALIPSKPGHILMSMGFGGSVDIWEFGPTQMEHGKSLTPPSEIFQGLGFRPSLIRYHPGRDRFWAASYNQLWSATVDDEWAVPIQVTSEVDCINDLAITTDGRRMFAACTYTNRIQMLEMGSKFSLEAKSPWLVSIQGDDLYVLEQDENEESILQVIRAATESPE